VNRRRLRFLSVMGLATVALIATVLPGASQERVPESQLLRQAAAMESVGDYDGARSLLEEVLDANPTSTGALFALERVLRASGQVVRVLPAVDAFLEADPSAAGPRYLKLRVLVEADSLDALQEEGWDWISDDPGSPDPYREVARVFQRALGVEAALEVLERGMASIDEPETLALEVGDLRLRAGDPDGAAREWARAVGVDGEQGSAVLRRAAQLQGDREAVVRPLVEVLGASDSSVARRRVAAQLALEGGMEEEAIRLSNEVLPELDGGGERAFLTDLARRAEDRRADRLALWAYTRLRESSSTESEVRALNLQIAETALLLGDTVQALEARRSAVDDLPPGSPERRRTLAQVIRLEAGREMVDSQGLRDSLRRYREEFPEAPELDGLASEVSARLQAEGDLEGAAAVLEGIDGPRSALERAYLSLDGSEPKAAREDLLRSLEGLSAARATEVIALAHLLDRSSPEGSALAARVTVMAHRGNHVGAVALIRESRGSLPGEDQAGILALGARVAVEGEDPELAADLLGRLIEEFPGAPETPEAMMTLAEIRSEDPATRAEAARILEDLILSRPNSPVTPSARRELDRLRTRGSTP